MTYRNDNDAGCTPTLQTAHVAPYQPTALPENEPHAMPLAERRSDLVAQIEALEGTLQYMGSLHPRRDEMRQRLRGLHTLLQRWDDMLGLQP